MAVKKTVSEPVTSVFSLILHNKSLFLVKFQVSNINGCVVGRLIKFYFIKSPLI